MSSISALPVMSSVATTWRTAVKLRHCPIGSTPKDVSNVTRWPEPSTKPSTSTDADGLLKYSEGSEKSGAGILIRERRLSWVTGYAPIGSLTNDGIFRPSLWQDKNSSATSRASLIVTSMSK